MSVRRLWIFLAIALPTLASLLGAMSTVDLAYHLRAGAEILATGSLPSLDTWTFTATGLPWIDQQWGAQVLFTSADRLGGWTGLAILRATLTGVIFACLIRVALIRGLTGRTGALLVLVTFVIAAPALALRPQLLAMACFAIVLVIIVDRRAHPGRLWVVAIVVILWANVHGSFFLGPVALGLAWLEDVHDHSDHARQTLGAAVVSAGAACITPFGPAVWLYAVGLSTNPQVTARITEWQATTLRDPAGLAFFASAAGLVVLIARRDGRVPWPMLAWLGAFGVVGLYALRGVAWWSLAAFVAATSLWPVVAARVDATERPTLRKLNGATAGLLIVLVVGLLPLWRPIDPATGGPLGLLRDAPGGITYALQSMGMSGQRILNPQPWGSWFERAIPEALVAIDSRIELFPAQVWDDYDRVKAGIDGWQDIVGGWGVTVVVLAVTETEVRDRFLAAGWRQTYGDDDGLILVRS